MGMREPVTYFYVAAEIAKSWSIETHRATHTKADKHTHAPNKYVERERKQKKDT